MTTQSWMFAGLAVVDLVILAGFYFRLRGTPPVDERVLNAQRVGLMGFVIHALMFCEGAILALQLAAIACIYGLCSLHHQGRLSRRSEKAPG